MSSERPSWGYGVQSVRPPGPIRPLAHHEAYDAGSRKEALDGLERLANHREAGGGTDVEWEEFYDELTAEHGRTVDGLDPEETLDFQVEGPDGMLYWIERLDY